jgi:hypothetical protein
VIVERRLGQIVPDVLITSGSHRLAIEVTVTHGLGEEKVRRARRLKISILEIDLRAVPRGLDVDELTAHVVGKSIGKRWASASARSLDSRSAKRVLEIGASRSGRSA